MNPTGKGGFVKGQSGNPTGRTRMPQAIRDMLTAKAKDAVQIITDRLSDADPRIALKAAELLLDRAFGKPQQTTEAIELEGFGDMSTAEGLLKFHTAVIAAAASGKIALSDAKEFSSLLEGHRRLVETSDLEARIAKLEKEGPK